MGSILLKLLLLLWVFPLLDFAPSAFAETRQVNAVGCSLFDSGGNLLKKYLGWICTYFPNGKMLLGDGFTLTFYDEKMDIVWSKDMHAHHMITYSPEDRTATVIASNIIEGDTRIDRLEVYDIEGHLLRSFPFTREDSLSVQPQNWDKFVFPQVKKELTLIESFYRIGKNQSKLPYLKEGNYLAYDAGGMLYFFDKDLHSIVHKTKVRDWGLSEIRDVQISPRGNLLWYNSGNLINGVHFTTLEERDPVSGKLAWEYRGTPPASFYGNYEGNLQILPSGNILFSVVMNELKGKKLWVVPDVQKEPWMQVQGMHRSYEITREGKRVWSMVNDGSGLSGMPNVIKRLDLTEYFRNKKRY